MFTLFMPCNWPSVFLASPEASTGPNLVESNPKEIAI
jgi:hypothetical protein